MQSRPASRLGLKFYLDERHGEASIDAINYWPYSAKATKGMLPVAYLKCRCACRQDRHFGRAMRSTTERSMAEREGLISFAQG